MKKGGTEEGAHKNYDFVIPRDGAVLDVFAAGNRDDYDAHLESMYCDSVEIDASPALFALSCPLGVRRGPRSSTAPD